MEKYWACESTPDEEKELRALFGQNDLPADLMGYIPLFSEAPEQEKLSDAFDHRVLSLIAKQQKRVLSVRVRRWAGIAAAVCILTGVGWYLGRPVNSYDRDTCETPEQALAEWSKSMQLISGTLQEGRNIVGEGLQKAEIVIKYIK